MKVGELVYLPTETLLRKFDRGATTKYCKVDCPTDVLVLKEDGDSILVHYRGEKWTVNRRDVYYG